MKKLFTLCFALLFINGWAQCPWTFSITNLTGPYTITCTNPTISLSASNNNTNSVNYLWTGPSFTSIISVANVTLPGTYTLVATDAVTSCSLLQTFAIGVNTVVPITSVSPITFTIGCLGGVSSFTGSVSIPTINVQHDWYSPLAPPNIGPPLTSGNGAISILSGTIPPGTYSLIVTDLANGCTTQKTVEIILTPTFSYSVIGGGVVNFQSTATGTTGGTTYGWDFGDGTSGTGISTSHTYSNGGIHNVIFNTINPNCYTNYIPINVNTIPCVANSGFTLVYSGTPQNWLASPNYYGNVTNALWAWGDGSTSNILFTNHTYSAAGLYNICLTVTVSCANSSSTCSGYNIYRSPVNIDMSMVTVSVVPKAPVGLKTNTLDDINFSFYPNPANEMLNIELEMKFETNMKIQIIDVIGQTVKEEQLIFKNKTAPIKIDDLPNGVYLLNLKGINSQTISKRFIISRN